MDKLSDQFAALVEAVQSAPADALPIGLDIAAFAFRHRDAILSALRASESAGEALPLNVLCEIFRKAEEAAGPRDPFAGDPMKWPNVAGVKAVRDAMVATPRASGRPLDYLKRVESANLIMVETLEMVAANQMDPEYIMSYVEGAIEGVKTLIADGFASPDVLPSPDIPGG